MKNRVPPVVSVLFLLSISFALADNSSHGELRTSTEIGDLRKARRSGQRRRTLTTRSGRRCAYRTIWAINGPYEPQGDPHTGKLPWRGEGWYRKSFTLPATDAGNGVYLDFDGVMAMPTVYINGRKAGGWNYGYVSFRVDATDFVKPGQTNVVAVHVDTRPHNSRWYPARASTAKCNWW